MKTQHIVLLLLFVIITFSACREISVTTKVNEDGSFTRIITITGDSADIFKKNLPYPIDLICQVGNNHVPGENPAQARPSLVPENKLETTLPYGTKTKN